MVICLDETAGVVWELEYLLKSGNLRKTLFVMNPAARNAEKNMTLRRMVVQRLKSIPGESLSESCEALLGYHEPVLGFFFDEGRRAKVAVSRQFSEASYLLIVRWFLRTAMDGELQPY